MRSSQRLLAVLLFAAVSLLALACSGMMDWITSSLFLILEFLAEFLRRLFGVRTPPRTHPSTHAHLPVKRRSRKTLHRRGLSTRNRSPVHDEPVLTPRARVLLPLSADQPELIEFALEECQARKAELLVLFLRPLAVLPMGPHPLPVLAEDSLALAVLERLSREAIELGVPLQTFYRVTADRPSTLIEVARNHQADVVVMQAAKRSWLGNLFACDMTRAVLSHLPEHVSLIVHAA